MVSLVRQPENCYDPNAVRVDNVNGVQVGHIKRELAKPLASIMDRRLARVEGLVHLLSVHSGILHAVGSILLVAI